jgi:hypothetical protein
MFSLQLLPWLKHVLIQRSLVNMTLVDTVLSNEQDQSLWMCSMASGWDMYVRSLGTTSLMKPVTVVVNSMLSEG